MSSGSRWLVLTALLLACRGGLAATPSFSIGANFSGSTLLQSGFIPPDTMGAIGPDDYVELLNGRYARYTKAGVLQNSSDLNTFWNTALAAGGGGSVQGSYAFDPRVMYDRHSGRWFATAVDALNSASSGILVGVTTGSDPSPTNWRGFRFAADPFGLRWADYPTIGINDTWVTISNNMFGLSGTVDPSISVLTIPKSSLVGGTPSVAGSTYFIDATATSANLLVYSSGFTLHPVYDYSAGSSGTAYLMSRYNANFIQVSTLTGTASNPTLTGARGVPTTTRTMGDLNAPQLGGNDTIDAGDARFSGSPVLVNGKIWGVHTFDSGGIARTAVYRIDADTNDLEYDAVVPLTSGSMWAYFPSIAVNPSGQIVVGFSGSDDATYASSYAIAGSFDGVNVTWGTEQLLKAGLSNYQQLDGIGRNRWGDYSAIQVDPVDPSRFWTIQEFASSTPNVWQTQVTELVLQPVPEPGTALVAVGGLAGVGCLRLRRRGRG